MFEESGKNEEVRDQSYENVGYRNHEKRKDVSCVLVTRLVKH